MKTVLVTTLIALFAAAHGQPGTSSAATFEAVLGSEGRYTIALMILRATGTTPIIANSPNITVFLPTDYAFRRVGRELGCENVTTVDETTSCITSMFSAQEVWRMVRYHVLLRVMPSKEIMKTKLFTTALGLPLFRKRLAFVDQVPQMRNAWLIPDKLDIKYENGLIHSISGVLMPFTTMLPDDPCDAFEFPLSLRNGSFIPIYLLARAVRKCADVRQATLNCNVQTSEICNVGRGKEMLTSGISIGKAVSAAKRCGAVRKALTDSCKFGPFM